MIDANSTSEEITEFIKTQRERVKKSEIEQGKLNGQITQLEESLEAVLSDLKEKYGIESIKEAEVEEKRLREEIIKEGNELKIMLDEAEGKLATD